MPLSVKTQTCNPAFIACLRNGNQIVIQKSCNSCNIMYSILVCPKLLKIFPETKSSYSQLINAVTLRK